jgi:hypothetical protein
VADVLTIRLTSRERELILKYGYPFEGIEHQLRSSCTKRGRVEISDTAYWWEQIVGNLSISVNEDVEEGDLLEELDELCNPSFA